MTFIIDVPLSLTLCCGRDRQNVVVSGGKMETVTFIIDVPLSLTNCSGRDNTKCDSEVEGKVETQLVQ